MTLKKNKIHQKLFTCLLLNAVFSVQAANNQKPIQTVELKCYVEVFGGQNLIYFAEVNKKNQPSFIKTLPGKMADSLRGKGEKKIYKAYECVKLSDQFNSAQARTVDEGTLR